MGWHVASESSLPMNWLGRSAGLVPESHCGQPWNHRWSISAAQQQVAAPLSLSAPSNEVRPHRRSSWVVRRGLVALDCRIPSGKDICTQWRVNSHFSLSKNHLILKVSEDSFVLPVASRPRGRNSQGPVGAKGKSPCYKPWNQLDLSAPFQLGGRISSPCLLS